MNLKRRFKKAKCYPKNKCCWLVVSKVLIEECFYALPDRNLYLYKNRLYQVMRKDDTTVVTE